MQEPSPRGVEMHLIFPPARSYDSCVCSHVFAPTELLTAASPTDHGELHLCASQKLLPGSEVPCYCPQTLTVRMGTNWVEVRLG